MARSGQQQTADRRTTQRTSQRSSNQRGGNGRNGRRRPLDNDGIIPVLARAVREVENAVERRSAMPGVRTKFQVVALLAREERIRVKGDTELTEAQRNEQLKRLDGIATILAKTAARDSTLFTLLAEDAVISDAAKELRKEMVAAAGLEAEVEEVEEVDETAVAATTERRVVPQSVISRQLANPFLAPDFSASDRKPLTHRLATWELLGPLFRSFEFAGAGATSCMALPGAGLAAGRRRPRADAPPGAAGRVRPSGSPHLPARRRAGPRQDRAVAAGRRGRRRVPAAGRRPQRREDELDPRGRHLDAAPRRRP